MNAYKNKNLIVPETIILNNQLDIVLSAIDKYWPPNGECVTSGVRTPDDQLRIIRQYLASRGLAKIYPLSMTCTVDEKIQDNGQGYYAWQWGWSALLSKGVIINPPFPAIALMDYIRNGVNKKGQLIGQSPHLRGKAFDISGTDSLTIVKRLVEDGQIKSYLLERENNCIHCDIF